MSKVIDEVRHKVACGQNLFRRSTIEKMLLEYDRLLLRNTALEKQAAQQKIGVMKEILVRMKEIENNDNTKLPIVDGWDAWAELKNWIAEQYAQ